MSSSLKGLVCPTKMNVRDFCWTDLRKPHWDFRRTPYLICFALGPRARVSFPDIPPDAFLIFGQGSLPSRSPGALVASPHAHLRRREAMN